MRKRPKPSTTAFFAAIAWIAAALAATFGAPPAVAQRLEIQAPDLVAEHAPLPMVWGHIQSDAVTIGGERLLRVRRPAAANAAPVSASPAVVIPVPVPLKAESPALKARFAFKQEERRACTDGVRFAAFTALLKSLRGRVEGVTWTAGEGWEECGTKVEAMLTRLGVKMAKEDSGTDGAALVIAFTSAKAAAVASAPAAAVAPVPPPPARPAVPVPPPAGSGIRVTIAGRGATMGEDGWFVYAAESYKKTTIVIEEGGYEPLELPVTPWPVPVGTSAPAAGSGLLQIDLAAGSVLGIAYVPTPPAAEKLELDLISGAGLGYGHNLPGEVRGQRVAFAVAASRREVAFGIGARAAVAATVAANSAVPWTLFADGTATMTGELGDATGVCRVGLGGRLFLAQVKAVNEKSPTLVPSDVLSPLFAVAAEKSLGKGLVGAHLNWTPLYVPGAGLHQSLGPGVEVGWTVAPGYTVTVEAGSETVKYPTATRETSLTLDTVSLGLKAGL